MNKATANIDQITHKSVLLKESIEYLRPMERRVVAMKADGVSTAEIAKRLNKSPTHVARMLRWIEIPRNRPAPHRYPTALESRVRHMRAEGLSHAEIGRRMGRTASFSERIEHLSALRQEA